MLVCSHVTALLPLLINDASARAEVGSQGQMLPAAKDTATDGAPGCLAFVSSDAKAFRPHGISAKSNSFPKSRRNKTNLTWLYVSIRV